MTPKTKFDIVPLAEVPKTDVTSLKKRPVILIVDDEKVIADTLSIILSNSGFETFAAYDGPSALALALEIAPRPPHLRRRHARNERHRPRHHCLRHSAGMQGAALLRPGRHRRSARTSAPFRSQLHSSHQARPPHRPAQTNLGMPHPPSIRSEPERPHPRGLTRERFHAPDPIRHLSIARPLPADKPLEKPSLLPKIPSPTHHSHQSLTTFFFKNNPRNRLSSPKSHNSHKTKPDKNEI